jgi:predicted GNAT superfamily acetyltransferase
MTSDDGLPTMGSAEGAAEAAALAAGVTLRELTELPELEAVSRLYEAIWRRDANPPLTTELLRAFAKAGNYVVGAFDGPELVGACVGFFSAPAEGTLHSHIAGVSSVVRGRSVGFALKVHQRAWALRREVPLIGWTFDPLVSRNAWFNLAKLAAAPVEYLPNFYGGMHDGINGDDDSDRLLVHWNLRSERVVEACRGRSVGADAAAELAGGAVVALGASPLGRPLPGPLDGPVSLVAVPPDVEGLRTADPGLAKEWRVAVREALVPLLADGARITGFDRSGWYVLRRPAAGQEDM